MSNSPVGRVTMPARELLESVPEGGAGLIVTDPPWDLGDGGMFASVARYPRLSVAEIADVLAAGRRALAPGAHLYCFATGGPELAEVFQEFTGRGWVFLKQVTWDRDWKWGLGSYRNAAEPVLIFANGRPSRPIPDLPVYPNLLKARSEGVRTAKPWQLYKAFMEKSSLPGELVVDPFCGTNPLETAAGYVHPSRRWLAGDVLTPEEVEAQLSENAWHKAAGKNNGHGWRRSGHRAPGETSLGGFGSVPLDG